MASKPQDDCYLSALITAAVARTLEQSDLMLTCCLSAANGWLVSTPARSSLLLLLHRLAGQGIARQACAHSIVDVSLIREETCIAVVCEAVCCMEMRPGL